MNQTSNRGRTFWDLIAEHPKMTFTLILVLVLAIVILAFNKYSIKSSVLTLEPNEKPTQVTRDTTAKSRNNLESESNIKNQTKPLVVQQRLAPAEKNADNASGRSDTVKSEVINVTSHNQSGGITANQVNIGAVPRKLDINVQNQLLGALQNKSEAIEITSIMGDSESFDFATQISDFLKANGYTKVDGVNQSVFTKPVIGQYLDRDSNGVRILIGAKPN